MINSFDIAWFDFDEPEAKGRVGVSRGDYGLNLHLEGQSEPVGFFDLFYLSELGAPESGKGFPGLLIYDNDAADEPLVKIVWTPNGVRLSLHRDIERFSDCDQALIHSDMPVYGLPRPVVENLEGEP